MMIGKKAFEFLIPHTRVYKPTRGLKRVVFNKRSSILTKVQDKRKIFPISGGGEMVVVVEKYLVSTDILIFWDKDIEDGRKSMNDTRDILILVRRPITLWSRRSIRCTNASADSSFGYYLRGNRCRPIVNSSISFHDERSSFASRWKHDTCLSID